MQKDKNRWIEKKYYKLWLSSTTVLTRIINNSQESNMNYYLEGIKEKLKQYVVTDNIDRALKKLDSVNMMLIHGEPGVGKTVLGEIIVFKYLAEGYKLKFVVGSNVVELEAILSVDNDEKEVIFLDDFLGANFLELFSKGDSEKLIFLLKKYINKKNKVVILTSRSTIYNKSIDKFENLNRFDIEFEKYKLEVTSYKNFDKAKIFYNHLYFSDLDNRYINEIKKEQRYFKVIKHRNYTPRLIEFITNKRRVSRLDAEGYMDFILESLNNPEEVWRSEFENNLSDEDRFLVWTKFTFSEDIDSGILEEAFWKRYEYEIKNNNFKLIQNAFNKSLKALSEGFFSVKKNPNGRGSLVSFVNPSIKDFLINYLKTDTLERKRILNSIVYVNQLDKLSNFSDEEKAIIGQSIIKNAHNIKSIDYNKEIYILEFIIREYKGKREYEIEIENILSNLIVSEDLDSSSTDELHYPDRFYKSHDTGNMLKIIMDLIINANIDKKEVEKTFNFSGERGDIRTIILSKVKYMDTFIKYLELLKSTLPTSDYRDFISKDFSIDVFLKSKISSMCESSLRRFMGQGLLVYDIGTVLQECYYYDDCGDIQLDRVEVEDYIERKLYHFTESIIENEEIKATKLGALIEKEIDEAYWTYYAYEDRLLETLEELWHLDYKGMIEPLDSDYRDEKMKVSNKDNGGVEKINSMFQGLGNN